MTAHTLDDDLDPEIICSLGKLSIHLNLLILWSIHGVINAPAPHGVPKRQHHILLSEDSAYLVELGPEGILLIIL